MDGIVSTDDLQVGMSGVWNGVTGTITKVDGGLYEFTTPAGSVIRMGFYWLAKDFKPGERNGQQGSGN